MAEFIKDLQLAELPPLNDYDTTSNLKGENAAEGVRGEAMNAAEAAGARSYICGGIIITFPSSVSDQQRQDALYSFLLLQLATDKQFNRMTQLKDWLKNFSTNAAHIGWIDQHPTLIDVKTTSSQFTPSEVALVEMEEKGSMAKDKATFQSIFTTLKGLPDSDARIQVFHSSTYDSSTHDVSVTFSSYDQDAPSGDLHMHFLLLNLGGGVKEASSRPLFHAYQAKDVSTKEEYYVFRELDQEVYAQTRAAVIQKLGDKIHTLIKEI